MVNPSLESPTIYAAAELDIALDMALKKHESELREMERRKQELQELSKQQRFEQSEEISTFKIIKGMRETVNVTLSDVALLEDEWVSVVPAILTVFSSLYLMENNKQFIDRGGTIRFITDITRPYIKVVQQHLDVGAEVRHLDKYTGLLFSVKDRKFCELAINADVKHISLSEPLIALRTDNSTYAEYLLSTFEILWEQAIPAAQRIEELLKDEPPNV